MATTAKKTLKRPQKPSVPIAPAVPLEMRLVREKDTRNYGVFTEVPEGKLARLTIGSMYIRLEDCEGVEAYTVVLTPDA